MLVTFKKWKSSIRKVGGREVQIISSNSVLCLLEQLLLVYQVRIGHISERKFENTRMKFKHLLSFLILKIEL